jgi:NADPH:quinone reductase
VLPLLTGDGRAHHGEILSKATRVGEAGRLSTSLDTHQFTLNTV